MGITDDRAGDNPALLSATDTYSIPWRAHEMQPGETLRGTVLRLPTPGTHNGSRLFLLTDDKQVVGLLATAKKGRAVLERELRKVAVRDAIEIRYHGKRATAHGERFYRFYEVERR